MKKTIIGGMAFVLLAAGAAVPFPGREEAAAQAADQRAPRYDAAAIIKLVAVRVLDAAGRPVTGLRKEDFLLTDNGARQVVTEFESYVLGEAGVELAAAGKETQLPAPLLKRRLFIFLDLQGSDADGLKNAKAAALHFIDTQLRPGDEVGVIGFSPIRGFFIQEYLTSDLGKIRKAIERAKELSPSAAATMGFGPDDGGGGPGGRGGGGRGAMVQSEGPGYAAGTSGDPNSANLGRGSGGVGSFIGAPATVTVPGTSKYAKNDFEPRMFDLAETLKYVPGNKSLVLFSSRDLGAAAKSLGQSFAASGTPIYAVNTKNWIMMGWLSPVREKHLYLEHSLKDLALASGGEYFADIEAVSTIAGEVQMLSGNFYVLGYYIKENWDGKFHKVGVEMKEPGYRVLAQAGYFSPKPFAEMSDFEKELHLFDLLYADRPAAEALDLPAAELGVALAEERFGVVLVEATVDPKAGVSPAKVELIALIRNEDRVPVISRKWSLDLSGYNGKILVFSIGSPKEPGKYDGRVVVRDIETGRPAAGRFSFEVPAPTAEGIVLSSPVILVPGEATKLVRLESQPARRGQAVERTLVDLYPFIPKDHRIVVRVIEAGTGQITAILPVRVLAGEGGAPPRVDVMARLIPRSGGDEIPLDVEVVEAKTSTDGREFLILRIDLPRPEPGEYELEIAAEEAASGWMDSVRTAIILK
jgi:VWFA-related protein